MKRRVERDIPVLFFKGSGELGRAGVVRFAYEKTDGTLRKAIGTLKGTAALVKGAGVAETGQTVRYYDVEASGWRSFRVENFVKAH